jgi:uncharacterized protein YhaN
MLCDHDGLRNLISNTDFAEQKQRAINREADRVLDFGKAGRRRLQEGILLLLSLIQLLVCSSIINSGIFTITITTTISIY